MTKAVLPARLADDIGCGEGTRTLDLMVMSHPSLPLDHPASIDYQNVIT